MAHENNWSPIQPGVLVDGFSATESIQRVFGETSALNSVSACSETTAWYFYLRSAPVPYFQEIEDSISIPYKKATRGASNYLQERLELLSQEKLETLDHHNHLKSSCGTVKLSCTLIVEISSLFKKVLQEFLTREKLRNPRSKLCPVLNNENFVHSLLALSFEIYLFCHNVTVVPFEEVFSLFDVNAFDFWKQMNTFAVAVSRIPMSFLVYLKEIENIIVSKLIWKEKSVFVETVRNLHKITQLPTAVVLVFKKIYNFAGQRTDKICQEIGLDGLVKQQIWLDLQKFMSEHTEYIINNTLDDAIFSVVYSFCEPLWGISITNLANKYKLVFPSSEISDSKFYEQIYKLLIKKQIGKCPRVPLLMQDKLIESLKRQQAFSPAWLTPRLEKIYNFQKRASVDISKTKASRKLNFDCYETPTKKFKSCN